MIKRYWLGYGIIALISSICYFPSVFHMPRADHTAYLAEVAQKKDFFSLAIGMADLPRIRLFIAGDQALFRPLLFFFLGVEKYFFGYQFMYWQMTGIILHLIVLGLLLKLLLNIRQGLLAFVLTGFLAVSLIPMEMVIWQQINGYLIFLAAALIALDQAYSYIDRKDMKFRRLIVIHIALLAACLTYEVGSMLCFLLWIYFRVNVPVKNRTWRHPVLILSPVLVYMLLNIWDWVCVRHMGMPQAMTGQTGGIGALLLGGIFATAVTQACWILFGVFPNQFGLILEERTTLLVYRAFQSLNVVSLAVVILSCFIFIRFKSRISLFRKWSFAALIFWIIVVYSQTLAIGRVMPRGWGVLTMNLYYSYIYWTFFLIFVYACIDFDRLKGFAYRRWFKGVILVCLGILMAINAFRVFKVNYNRAILSQNSRMLVQSIEQLKKAHSKDGKFTFYVSESFPGNYDISWLSKTGDPLDKRYTFIEALYQGSFDKEAPMFSVK